MLLRRLALLICCVSVGIIAFLVLDFWNYRNQPIFRKFERLWLEDVRQLEDSGKLPKFWFDVTEAKVIGGTAESRKWVQLVKNPVKINPEGHHRMEILIVFWEEEGVRGALVQYNIENIKSKESIWELGRTLILFDPKKPKVTWQTLIEEFF